MVANLEQTFSRLGTFDPDAVNSVPLRAAKPWLDNPFTDNEISAAVRKLANGKSAGEAANAPWSISRRLKKTLPQRFTCVK